MIISDDRKIIFVHNPKCGGTSIRASLAEIDTRNNFYWMFDSKFQIDFDKAHLSLERLSMFYPNEFNLFRQYFVFGFVRNPIERFASSFNEANQKIYNNVKSGDESYEAYISKLNHCAKNLSYAEVSGSDFAFRHYIEQNKMYYLNGKCYADLILKVEEMDSSSDKLAYFSKDLSDLAINWKGSKKNVKHLPFNPVDYLDELSIQNLMKIYKNDFLLFGY